MFFRYSYPQIYFFFRSISPVAPLRARDLLAFRLSNLPGKPEGSRIADYGIMSGILEISHQGPIHPRCSSQKYHYDFVSVIASLGVQPDSDPSPLSLSPRGGHRAVGINLAWYFNADTS